MHLHASVDPAAGSQDADEQHHQLGDTTRARTKQTAHGTFGGCVLYQSAGPPSSSSAATNLRLLGCLGSLLEEGDPFLLAFAPRLLAALPAELPTGEVVRADQGTRKGAHAHRLGERTGPDPCDKAGRAAAGCSCDAVVLGLDQVGDRVVDIGEDETGSRWSGEKQVTKTSRVSGGRVPHVDLADCAVLK